MKYITNIIVSIIFILILSSSTCVNQNTVKNIISPSAFIVLDSYIAVQIDIAADKCFDRVDNTENTDEGLYTQWRFCMDDYYEMESLLFSIHRNIEKNERDSLEKNLTLLIQLMDLLGLDIPEGIQN